MMSFSSSNAAATLELQESGWEELQREARKLEGDLDVKLSSYTRLAARFSSSASASPTADRSSWKSMEFEIQSLLGKLQDVKVALQSLLGNAGGREVAQGRELAGEGGPTTRRRRARRRRDGDGDAVGE